ncbi:MAG: UDP-N-acetylmuramoyl-L-alanine--D-glutamate ligase [Sideroxydans sp.]|nr:UDP-N-acetylmuramoyl-L-alanine--D-glutamate ligase [Sideroxydans sp.]
MKIWSDKFVLVLGLGETGLSMLRYLSAQGARLRAADSRTAPASLAVAASYVQPEQIFCGAFSDALFDDIDCIAMSPGVPLADPVVAKAVARGIEVVGDIELFAQHLSACAATLNPQVLAITGSNGKTTVTSLVTHLCQVAGLDAVAAGNISPAVLDVMMQRGAAQPDVWVLELSSFQLETTTSLRAAAATVLNLSEDHLDRYDGMSGYIAAKARALLGCRLQVLNRDDTATLELARADVATVTFGLDTPTREQDFGVARFDGELYLMQGTQRLMRANELQLSGLHNVANALAALALCRAIDVPMAALLDGLRSFHGLAHRVEKVAQIASVTYYDDSKGTNVGATVAALQGLGCKAVLIAGGEGKGQDFAALAVAVKNHARAVVLIGRDAELIAAALATTAVKIERAADMPSAVQAAARLAQEGDAVLLSPACASFDMFRNYEHRAQVFIAAVRELTPSTSPLSEGKINAEGAWSH